MEKGLKDDNQRKSSGRMINKPDVYDEYYVRLRNGVDCMVIKAVGVVLTKGDNVCFVPRVQPDPTGDHLVRM